MKHTEELDMSAIPAAPDIGFKVNVPVQLPTTSYRGKPLAAVLYNAATSSGGVLDLPLMLWICWSPITPEQFAVNVEAAVEALREREDGRLAALNS